MKELEEVIVGVVVGEVSDEVIMKYMVKEERYRKLLVERRSRDSMWYGIRCSKCGIRREC